MQKLLKVIGIVLGIIVVLGIVFFIVDYNRVQKQEKPIFCIQNPAGIINDGGTIEYFGLGYKVIDFHTLAGYDDIKIGSWFMDYNDFEEEMKEYAWLLKYHINRKTRLVYLFNKFLGYNVMLSLLKSTNVRLISNRQSSGADGA